MRSRRCASKLARLKELVERRERWRAELECVRRMHGWVLEAEAILSGEWAGPEEKVTSAGVALRFDAWIAKLKEEASGQKAHADGTGMSVPLPARHHQPPATVAQLLRCPWVAAYEQ